jgi:ABC-2 type transport system ATP-binding protein
MVRPYSSGEIQIDREQQHLAIPVTRGAQQLIAVVRDLDAGHIPMADLALRKPTLDDVFLALTGHMASEEDQITEKIPIRRSPARSMS